MDIFNQNHPDLPSEAVLQDRCCFYVCGSRGSHPVHGRQFEEFGGQTSCYILRFGDRAVIVDCGSGLFGAESILAGCRNIDILITHVHYDHIIGLLSFRMFPENAVIRIFGCFSSWFGKASLDDLYRPPFWPVCMRIGEIIDVPADGSLHPLTEDVAFSFYPTGHPNSCNLVHLKYRQQNISVVTDCEDPRSIPETYLGSCTLLICDGTYNRESYPSHVGWGHASWEESCIIAQKYQPELLLITHHDPVNADAVLRQWEQSAQAMFSHTHFARAGDVIVLPNE